MTRFSVNLNYDALLLNLSKKSYNSRKNTINGFIFKLDKIKIIPSQLLKLISLYLIEWRLERLCTIRTMVCSNILLCLPSTLPNLFFLFTRNLGKSSMVLFFFFKNARTTFRKPFIQVLRNPLYEKVNFLIQLTFYIIFTFADMFNIC